mmetsp:Transcript_110304/g.329831  ORF Transcript_110304/g.329831 Transcript_110304/m.329831 type:complete len:259 (+) Transcript_110304:212-988(+)
MQTRKHGVHPVNVRRLVCRADVHCHGCESYTRESIEDMHPSAPETALHHDSVRGLRRAQLLSLAPGKLQDVLADRVRDVECRMRPRTHGLDDPPLHDRHLDHLADGLLDFRGEGHGRAVLGAEGLHRVPDLLQLRAAVRLEVDAGEILLHVVADLLRGQLLEHPLLRILAHALLDFFGAWHREAPLRVVGLDELPALLEDRLAVRLERGAGELLLDQRADLLRGLLLDILVGGHCARVLEQIVGDGKRQAVLGAAGHR